MATPKRTPIERSAIKGIGNLTRNNQLSPKAQKETSRRVSRKVKNVK